MFEYELNEVVSKTLFRLASMSKDREYDIETDFRGENEIKVKCPNLCNPPTSWKHKLPAEFSYSEYEPTVIVEVVGVQGPNNVIMKITEIGDY